MISESLVPAVMGSSSPLSPSWAFRIRQGRHTINGSHVSRSTLPDLPEDVWSGVPFRRVSPDLSVVGNAGSDSSSAEMRYIYQHIYSTTEL